MSTNSVSHPAQIRANDWLWLCLFCVALFAIPIFIDPLMGIHETIHCVNTREMLETGDLVIPTHGGRPWLERPPLPFYFTGALVAITGQPTETWPYRLGSILAGLLCVLLVTAIGARLFGRGIGLLAGYTLATLREMVIYSSQPEADIILCLVITVAMFLFARCVFDEETSQDERVGFFGGRPWPFLAFFVVLGATNVAKGLFFGMLIVLVPIGAYLLLSRKWRDIRKFCWLWGWLAFLVVSLPWPIAAYLRVPSVVELWKSDYLGRLYGVAKADPWWYYAANLMWCLFPWTTSALLGLWLTRPNRDEPKRVGGHNYDFFLWCWAITPILWLSLNRWKHHHYLLHVMAPWAILAALGTVRYWVWFRERPSAWKSPITGAMLTGLPVAVLAFVFRDKIPGPSWLAPALAGGWLTFAVVVWWATGQASGRVALGTVCVALFVGYVAGKTYWDRCIHRPKYVHDVAFVERVLDHVPPGERLVLNPNMGALVPSWWLHYLEGRAEMLHNITFLKTDRFGDEKLYLIARPVDEPAMSEHGEFERVFQSERSKRESGPAERWTLYRFRFHHDLRRVQAPPIDAMQATQRAPGPIVK